MPTPAAPSPEELAEPPQSLADGRTYPRARVGLISGTFFGVGRDGAGAVAGVVATYSDLLPIIDPQVVVLVHATTGEASAPSALVGVGARVTFPMLGPMEPTLDLAVTFDTRGRLWGQMGALLGWRLHPQWQLGVGVAYLARRPGAAGFLCPRLELVYLW
jgi:hypothetical protein